jgi:hypothetical protein
MRIWTDFTGEIVRVSKEAAQLFNLSEQNLRARPIHYFFDGDRQPLSAALERSARGSNAMVAGVLRPRDRRPCAVLVILERDEVQSELVRWTLRPAPFKHTVLTTERAPSAA